MTQLTALSLSSPQIGRPVLKTLTTTALGGICIPKSIPERAGHHFHPSTGYCEGRNSWLQTPSPVKQTFLPELVALSFYALHFSWKLFNLTKQLLTVLPGLWMRARCLLCSPPPTCPCFLAWQHFPQDLPGALITSLCFLLPDFLNLLPVSRKPQIHAS